jgi:hypothetical protein
MSPQPNMPIPELIRLALTQADALLEDEAELLIELADFLEELGIEEYADIFRLTTKDD